MIDSPRLDLLIAKHGRTLVFALVAVGVLSFAATGWVLATPETTTTTEAVGEEGVTSDVSTSAVVVEDGLWEEGTRLEDSAVYMYDATPELTFEPRTTVPGDEGEVTHELEVEYEASRDGRVFWNDTDTVLEEDASVEDGVARSEATVDVAEVRNRTGELESRLDGVGSVDVSLAFSVSYDDGTYSGDLTDSTALELTGDAYWLEESLSDDDTYPQTVEREVTESPNPLVVGGLSLLGTLALAGAAFVNSRSSIDVERARRAVHERRYDEWISRGSIPMWIGDHHVSLDTLEDVVDVAIDTNERVVHDRQRGLFAVVTDGVVYYYSDRGRWEETAWPDMTLEGAGTSAGAGDVDAESDANRSAGGEQTLEDRFGTDDGDEPEIHGFSADDE
ncbi:DUF5305 domain-containing protein [Natrialbaceae archaeon GCM10025810]|uniref:DUF5305 domain-containing protein n=1 Tax=Halovalidus salilacus TaxID=3075124 RepID=UPI003621FBB3